MAVIGPRSTVVAENLEVRTTGLNDKSFANAILRSIAASDSSLFGTERDAITRLLEGRVDEAWFATWGAAPRLQTQKQAASALGISRVTLCV